MRVITHLHLYPLIMKSFFSCLFDVSLSFLCICLSAVFRIQYICLGKQSYLFQVPTLLLLLSKVFIETLTILLIFGCPLSFGFRVLFIL